MSKLYLLLAVVAILFLFILVWFISRKIITSIKSSKSSSLLKIVKRFGNKSNIDIGKRRLITITRIISFVLYIALIYLAVICLFEILPQTQIIGEKLLNILYEPLKIGAEIIYQILLIALKFIIIGALAYLIIWAINRILTIIIARDIDRKAKVKKSTIKIISNVIKIITVIILAIYFIFSIPITHSPYFLWSLLALASLLIIIFLPKILDIISGLIIPFVFNISPGDLIKIGEKTGLITDIDLLSVQIETYGGIRDQLPTRAFLWRGVRIICQDYEKLPIWINIDVYGIKENLIDELLNMIRTNKLFKNSEISVYITRIEDERITFQINLNMPSPEKFWQGQMTTIDIINRFFQERKLRCRITSEIGQLI